jgi:hypothetical protein
MPHRNIPQHLGTVNMPRTSLDKPNLSVVEPVEDEITPAELLEQMARDYGFRALTTLDKIANSDDYSDGARVAACKELIDRGFGKVPQPVEGGSSPVTVVNVVTGVRGRD